MNTDTPTHGYTREQQIEALHKLRAPFDPSEIRYLPRIWCKACRDSRGQGCQNHPRRQCRTCGQSLPGGHIDLKFVGHAEATNRLLNVDPFWEWEPMATDANGLPQFDSNRGMWIKLTVCGMTRLGYGNAEGKTGGDAIKEIIGDAIRNAGMRFGMALDLWTSSDLEITEAPTPEPDMHVQPSARQTNAELGERRAETAKEQPTPPQEPSQDAANPAGEIAWEIDDLLTNRTASDTAGALDVLATLHDEAEGVGLLSALARVPYKLIEAYPNAPQEAPLGQVFAEAKKYVEALGT